MAAARKRPKAGEESNGGTAPTLPYCTTPGSLRRFLETVPKKPRPERINATLLKSWDLRNTNDQSIIRVLKALGLVSPSNEPTNVYTAFMTLGTGASALGREVRRVYDPLFKASHEPHRESSETLRNLFNIHSGGGQRTLDYQIQTFKALCDFSDLSGKAAAPASNAGASNAGSRGAPEETASGAGAPSIHIDLHIHLPENKSRRDYEYMFEDIARYIFRSGEPKRIDEAT